ncbi:MAG: hypothetical protein H0U27_09970 [Nitrosopumilus sp.]|nr:hypothetical protein [Nitrosopumilus sp.]MBA3550856.1 hypothetical protein [Patescibacteria group bacterium]
MKKQFLKEYDSTVEDVFSYYYERTYDRGKSLELVREHFIKNWQNLSRNKAPTLRSQTVEESDASEPAPKSSAPQDSLKYNINQFGY